MSCHALACFTCPEMTRWALCSTSSTGAHHQESGISAKQKPMFLWQVPPPRKEQKCVVACTCLSRTIKMDWTDSSNSTDWEPESASTVQDLPWILISRINIFFSTERKAKNDTKGTFSCRSAPESRSFCNADLLPQLSGPPNPTQHAFKEHQLAATLLRCALQCTSVGPCKTWPFVHDQPLARRLQLGSRMTCKALPAWEDAQRASLFCFFTCFQGHRTRIAFYLFTIPLNALLPSTRWTTYMLSCCSVPGPIFRLSWNRCEISIGFPKKGYNPPQCTVPICWR